MKLGIDLRYAEHKYLIRNFTKALDLTPLTWHIEDVYMIPDFMRTSDFTSPSRSWLPSEKIQ